MKLQLVGRRIVIYLLLSKAIDINIVYPDGYTVLIKAVAVQQDAVVQLLKKGADITIRTNDGETALHAAAKKGYRGIVQQLLEKGADTIAKDNEGFTPLWWAVKGGYRAVIQLLLDKCADINIIYPDGGTALSQSIF